jgi:hypothetical protein
LRGIRGEEEGIEMIAAARAGGMKKGRRRMSRLAE